MQGRKDVAQCLETCIKFLMLFLADENEWGNAGPFTASHLKTSPLLEINPHV